MVHLQLNPHIHTTKVSRCRPAIPKGRHSEQSAIPKAVIQGLRGIIVDIVSYYLTYRDLRGQGGHPPRCQKSPFTFPMLHKQLVSDDSLSYCLPLFIASYSLVSAGFWCIFTVLFIEYNL